MKLIKLLSCILIIPTMLFSCTQNSGGGRSDDYTIDDAENWFSEHESTAKFRDYNSVTYTWNFSNSSDAAWSLYYANSFLNDVSDIYGNEAFTLILNAFNCGKQDSHYFDYGFTPCHFTVNRFYNYLSRYTAADKLKFMISRDCLEIVISSGYYKYDDEVDDYIYVKSIKNKFTIDKDLYVVKQEFIYDNYDLMGSGTDLINGNLSMRIDGYRPLSLCSVEGAIAWANKRSYQAPTYSADASYIYNFGGATYNWENAGYSILNNHTSGIGKLVSDLIGFDIDFSNLYSGGSGTKSSFNSFNEEYVTPYIDITTNSFVNAIYYSITSDDHLIYVNRRYEGTLNHIYDFTCEYDGSGLLTKSILKIFDAVYTGTSYVLEGTFNVSYTITIN